MDTDGVMTVTLPAEQSYKKKSFGIGANTMVAVTDGYLFTFKNVGGYLSLQLYGDNVAVSRVTIKGNNGEKIAGNASVSIPLGGLPTVIMDETATDEISIVCDPAVQLGNSAEEYTNFWFVIPPVTFSQGFTITVTDDKGGVFEKATTKSFTVSRNKLDWMNPLKVAINANSYGIKAVDLGLSVLWASCNFEASIPEDMGGLYAWGEIETKTVYDWSTYKWCNGTENSLTKYNTMSLYGKVDNKSRLEPADDVVRVKIGGKWRLPTYAEIQELVRSCTFEYTAANKAHGHIVTSNINGNTIFLPMFWNDSADREEGNYLSDQTMDNLPISVHRLLLLTDGPYPNAYARRPWSYMIRPVCEK